MDDPIAIEGDNSVAIVFTRLENAGFQLLLSAVRNHGLSVSRGGGEGSPCKKNQQGNPTCDRMFKTAHDGALT